MQKNEISSSLLEKNPNELFKSFFCKYLMFSLMFFLLFLATKINLLKETLHFIFSPNSVVVIICLYYVNLIFKHQSLNTTKILFLNFLCIISLYNILLLYNPINMIELKDEYTISNIYYFYLSFLVISHEFNIFNSIQKNITFSFQLFYSVKKDALIFIFICFLTFIFFIFIIALFHALLPSIDFHDFNLISSITSTFILITLIFTFFCYILNNKIVFVFFKINEKLLKIKNNVNLFIQFLLDIFKITPIHHDKDINMNKKTHLFIIIFSKFFLFLMLTFFISNNTYYSLYKTPNGNYCTNLDKEIYIIKLKNNNVLLLNQNNFSYQEYKCEKPLKTIFISL